MKKSLKLLLVLGFFAPASFAVAQNYPTPTFGATQFNSSISLGISGSAAGQAIFNNATSGTITLQAPSGALGTVTDTLPLGGTLLNSTTGATSGANSNITSLSGLTTPLSTSQGGTGNTTGTSSPAGATTQVQYNNGGALAGSNAFTYTGGTVTLGVAGTTIGQLAMTNATSGTLTLAPPTGALGTVTVTLPDGGTLLNSITGATSGANSNITSLTGLTTPLAASEGGTGASSFGSALTTTFTGLSTTLPGTAGVIWNDGGLLAKS
jgi:hypothetical protein